MGITERDKIKQVFYKFIESGLLRQNEEEVLECIADEILGIGMGEQGFVTSKEDIKKVLVSGRKTDDNTKRYVRYLRTEVLMHSDCFATVCSEISIFKANERQTDLESRFFQLVTLKKERSEWKVCSLHASTPVVTEELLDVYPLKLAEKTLENLKAKIGEQAYQAEEQYRQAILSDTIAFYIINFSKNVFEKCQCKSDLCMSVEPGSLYEQQSIQKSSEYIYKEDIDGFFHTFSLNSIFTAIQMNKTELSYEYRLKDHSNGYIWVITTVSIIKDPEDGEYKGIMYVRNIDQKKREEEELLSRATTDGMTKLLNKSSLKEQVNQYLSDSCAKKSFVQSIFIMLDVDNFKTINDTYGHPIGDQVLIVISNVLKDFFDSSAIIGRLGGDEFTVFLPDVADDKLLAQKLAHLLARLHHICIIEAPTLTVTCSIGATLCHMCSDFDEVYRQADSALYQAKEHGKHRYCIYEG